MYKFWLFFVLVILLFTVSCKTQQKVDKGLKDPFTVIKATQEHWHTGVRGGGSGTDYKIQLLINTNKPITFDSIWIANTRLKVKLVKNGSILNNKSDIQKGDTITLRSTLLKYEHSKPEQIACPVEKDDLQVLIRYYLDKEPTFFLTKDLEEVKGPLRP